jgi:hypothetical protein
MAVLQKKLDEYGAKTGKQQRKEPDVVRFFRVRHAASADRLRF